MVYKDITFCNKRTCKNFKYCSRAYTDDIAKDAKDLGLHVSLSVFSCWKAYENEDNTERKQ